MSEPGATGGRLEGRIALITGASRGIGAAVAKRFAEEGARLVLTARTPGALEEIDDEIQKITGEPATLVPLDLTDFDAIDQMGAAIFERFKKLDILVGNAGQLGTLSPMGHLKPEVWAGVMDVNLTANWRLIRSMDPLLKASDAGRAMFVSSAVGRKARAYWGAYAVSKAALEMMALIYAAEVEKTNVRVNLINPGATRTAMRAKAFPGEDPNTLHTPESITGTFVELAEASCTRNGELLVA
ncbi:MAG TPA: SDR family NAD(P)-dependent oxidoreductase [Rhodospirillales bacterium]|jgi:NAD(P)-dependent dehydrogenase (short-subunit alcohol dehydrogenase family)|nr:MAG: oxidoreductase [Rhodospirillaceae bacterium]PPR70282.1 MAG: putative oxidoreductase YciK [Alphaproteobacteria bacterium MarineAlpha3_Bin1]PPR73817.1 MAG: putative oxidoreductase YciK [Alphaproteobacteria bacterium MarineAlpha3_Bin2]HIE20076.1 SDR family NAD(P)-dependent oxidoreductase [Rhodospirillales bacterium]HIM24492.1 SDR family NAD(P)-dependent oxidoreductase [Rhodospirillales bacterium]